MKLPMLQLINDVWLWVSQYHYLLVDRIMDLVKQCRSEKSNSAQTQHGWLNICVPLKHTAMIRPLML